MDQLDQTAISDATRRPLLFVMFMMMIDCGLVVLAVVLQALGFPAPIAAAIRSLEVVGPLLGIAHVVLPLALAMDRRSQPAAAVEATPV